MIDLRKIDALVATHLLAFERIELVHSSHGSTRTFTWRDPVQKELYDDESLPRFTVDIAAAWEVVEKLRSKGCTMDLFDTPDHGWQAAFDTDPCGDHEETVCGGFGPTVPIAICLGALKAAGIEVTF